MSSAAEMSKTFKLPLVPGSSSGEDLLRRDFKKRQIFGSKRGVVGVSSQAVPVDFGDSLKVARSPTKTSEGHCDSAAQLERRVLRYFGYYREHVTESNLEKERVRKIVLCYYLEDGTLSVTEPKQDNSGIVQGTAVKRHQVPRPDGNGTISFDELAVGSTITFYGRSYFLVDCDKFTKEILGSLKIQVADPLPYPEDSHTLQRARPAKVNNVPSIATAQCTTKLSSTQIRSAKQFLEFDRKVLRCDACWDDTASLYGERHFFTLYYFCADDTIEVVEKQQNNCGRDPFPSFVRRQKMPKPKAATNKFENQTSSLTFKGKDPDHQFYVVTDIVLGASLNLFGRVVLIYDYDKFTRDYLRETVGVTQYTPILMEVKAASVPAREPPPYNGYGDEEDSLSSCKRLDIKAPKKDGTKFAKFGDNVVKFSLKLENNVPTDDIRKFVLSAYLADDTIAVFEPIQRNSGIVGGKFLQRTKVKNPLTGKNFVASDFFVGCRTVINGFPFVCLATDERSLSYMEQNSATFQKSDVSGIVHKLQAMLLASGTGLADAFHNADANGNGALDYQQFSGIMKRLGLELSEQEILTVLRHFDNNGESYISFEEFAARILPDGAIVAKDSRNWEEIYHGMIVAEKEQASVEEQVSQQKEKVTTTTAAYAARAFAECYSNRRTLFHQEFKFICDFAIDEKIGEKEFRTCITTKLHLPLTFVQIDCLCLKLFPTGSRRLCFEEFLRIINNTSNLSHNIDQIKQQRIE